ncbi:MAG TPA: hypothetical protein PK177_00980 [Burkholderiaceae bacterium]|nr:hypothetical protein [Burkholderiaceae bacterium]
MEIDATQAVHPHRAGRRDRDASSLPSNHGERGSIADDDGEVRRGDRAFDEIQSAGNAIAGKRYCAGPAGEVCVTKRQACIRVAVSHAGEQAIDLRRIVAAIGERQVEQAGIDQRRGACGTTQFLQHDQQFVHTAFGWIASQRGNALPGEQGPETPQRGRIDAALHCFGDGPSLGKQAAHGIPQKAAFLVGRKVRGARVRIFMHSGHFPDPH